MGSSKYKKNKEEKQNLYKDNNVPLIEIEKDDWKDVSGLEARIMMEYKTFKEEIKKHI